MIRQFTYSNITLKQHPEGPWVMAQGEITNKSGRNFHSVVFRIILFIRSTPIGNVTVTINGFLNNQTRQFEKQVGELEYKKVCEDITKIDIYPESAY